MFSELAVQSVHEARENRRHIFDEVVIMVVEDHRGELGRSKARNRGMDAHPDADWYFFLDADDLMGPNTINQFSLLYPMIEKCEAKAVFGNVIINWGLPPNIQPKTTSENREVNGYEDLVQFGSKGTCSMGFFCSGPEARAHRWNEDLDFGEDFEFYLSFGTKHHICKVPSTFCYIGRAIPSARGRRGVDRRFPLDWHDKCAPFLRFHRNRTPGPMSDEERKECSDLAKKFCSR